jgi:hypothetical protein
VFYPLFTRFSSPSTAGTGSFHPSTPGNRDPHPDNFAAYPQNPPQRAEDPESKPAPPPSGRPRASQRRPNSVATCRKALSKSSHASGVVSQPALTRTIRSLAWAGYPILAKTGDGTSLPDEQALPVETANPSRSKRTTHRRRQSAAGGMSTDTVFQRRGTTRHRTSTPGMAASNCSIHRSRIL